MLTVLPQTSRLNLDDAKPAALQWNELGSLQDALEPFKKSILRSGNAAVHLHCKVPTWCQSDTCLDLHDLHELRSRLLLFIPSLISSLRLSGVSATYSLVPSDTSLCVVCAYPPGLCSPKTKAATDEYLRDTKLSKRKNAVLADLKHGPALILT